MPPVLPVSLVRLLSLLRAGFTAPTFDTFCWLVYGFVGRVGEHTVTGIWQAARLGGVFHHSRAHDFFARRRWSPDRLGLSLCDFVVGLLTAAKEPIGIAVDDTLFTRTGRKVFGASWLFEQAAPKGRSTPKMGFGNSFVCLGVCVAVEDLLRGKAVVGAQHGENRPVVALRVAGDDETDALVAEHPKPDAVKAQHVGYQFSPVANEPQLAPAGVRG